MKHEKAPTTLPPHSKGFCYLVYAHVSKKHFGQIRPFPVAESGQNCQKAHLQAKTFHLSLFTSLYDHPLQRKNLESSCFVKPLFLDILAKFGHFPKLSKGTSTGQALPYEPILRSLVYTHPL